MKKVGVNVVNDFHMKIILNVNKKNLKIHNLLVLGNIIKANLNYRFI